MGPAVAPQFKDWGLFVNSREQTRATLSKPQRESRRWTNAVHEQRDLVGTGKGRAGKLQARPHKLQRAKHRIA